MKVANYPGVTVEKREGVLIGTEITLLDLPGVYSLSARSPDEEIARDVLQGRLPGTRRPDVVLIVVDASNLERNLYLATQIIEFGTPVVVACNMMDMAAQRGLQVDCAELSRRLGVPVVATIGARGVGLAELREQLLSSSTCSSPGRQWRLPDVFEKSVDRVAKRLRECGLVPTHTAPAGALLWMVDYLSGDTASRRSAERFLARLSAERAEGMRQEAEALAKELPDAASEAIEARYEWIAEVVGSVVRHETTTSGTAWGVAHRTPTDRVDAVLTHRFFGPLIFAVVMFVLFLSIFAWAEPLMSLIEAGQNALAGFVASRMDEGPLQSLLTDGIIAGVGAVLIFFPQICILFFCLALLEDSGYMARAAFIMDRLMSRVGLHGKSFIPLLSSYACAIPGILATRTIEDRRDRFTTILVAPLMSCSARLPVYIIIIAAVFGERTLLKAGVMFSMYALGTITALLLALLFKKTLFAGPRPPFIMELPPYHMPKLGGLLRLTWDRGKLFLTNAGTIIFAVCVVIWALSYFPRTSEADFSDDAKARLAAVSPEDEGERDDLIASERLRHSYIGRMGRMIEPAIEPLGFDWRIGIGVLSSFLAREVFVGTMGITFAVGEADEESIGLREQLAGATWPDGRKLMTPLTGIGLMVFYVLACQCVSTLAVVRKETGTWRWPAFMFAYMSILAYVAALAVYQIGGRFGWGT